MNSVITHEMRKVAEGFARGKLDSGRIVELRGWSAVGKAFQDCHPSCETCQFCQVTEERHPYGMGTASEFLADCTLGEVTTHRPEQCPALQQVTEQESAHG